MPIRGTDDRRYSRRGDAVPLPLPLPERFYGAVRADELLGRLFDGAVHDRPGQLDRLRDFWSSVMRTRAGSLAPTSLNGSCATNPVAVKLRTR